MKKKTILRQLENRKYQTLTKIIEEVNSELRGMYQFRLSQIENAILEIKRT